MAVTDRAGNVTQFRYRTEAGVEHYLERILDPLGRPAARTEYYPIGYGSEMAHQTDGPDADEFGYGPLGDNAMRQFLYFGSAVLVAVILGASSAWWVIGQGARTFVRNGPWHYNPLVGSAAANAHVRAQIARAGLLALNSSEAVYFLAHTDSDGNPLHGDRTYRIEGGDLDARWWSITAYGADHFLMPHDGERHSCCSATVRRDADGRFIVYVSAAERPGNWIPVCAGAPFLLALRIYNPGPSIRDHLDAVELPRIIPEEGPHE
ncbi:MAG TPA: DUF1214 domain-containing protein [Gemmataceae bacterium]|nr:DUF1214 domain-containing protein [Gemmataceae bacterium]